MVQTAERMGMLYYDDRGVPRVGDDEAREFLIRIAGNLASGDMELMMRKLERTFDPDRIKYFVTSVIGFFLDPRTGYDPDDFQNVLTDRGIRRISGPVHPINVAEPVLWLAEQVADPDLEY
jgi:hypothetical protein